MELDPETRDRFTSLQQEVFGVEQQLKGPDIEGAVVAYDITPVGRLVLVSCPSDADVIPIFLDDFSSDSLDGLTWPGAAEDSGLPTWLGAYPHQPKEDWPEWQAHQPEILDKLGNWLWPSLDSLFQAHQVKHVLLVPQGGLFLYPLHAALFRPLDGDTEERVYPLERYTIVYTPSIRLYDHLSESSQVSLAGGEALFIEDPDGDPWFLICRSTVVM